MSESPALLQQLLAAPRAEKVTRAWQDALWAYWPTPAAWPVTMDLCEAAAYKHLHPATLRNLCAAAKLRHQRIGAAYRIAKADLDRFGLVEPQVGQSADQPTAAAAGGGR